MKKIYKYLLMPVCLTIGCGIVIIDPSPNTDGHGGASSSASSNVSSSSVSEDVSSSSSVAESSSNTSSSSSGMEEECTPGQFIPGTNGGPDGGLSLCCEEGKTLCIKICCQVVVTNSDGSVEVSFCAANPELGYCCPNEFVCLDKP